mmetsp:Transcript_29432/g.90039  ORF Transcript_29432/g.90039 Transcript_29432/m.90039 type:complete len:80 (-) Transcript_29432:334-573(-)
MAFQASESLCRGLPGELKEFVDVCRGTTDLAATTHFESRFQKPVDYDFLRQLLEKAKSGTSPAANESPTSVQTTPTYPD